jgi:hypothetical protein
MSNEIIKVLDVLSKKAGVAVDWTSVNIVPYIRKITNNMVRYELLSSIIWIIISLAIIIATVIISKYLFVKSTSINEINDNDTTDDDDEYDNGDTELSIKVVICVIAFLIILAFGICIISQILDITKCITYPEGIVIEYIKDMYDTK